MYRAVYVVIRWPKIMIMSFPIAARYKACVCGRSLAVSVISNPAAGMGFCLCECCVFSVGGLCVGLISHVQRSPTECGVSN
jgi:hypothetical protein